MCQLRKPVAWVACRIEKVSDQLGMGVIIMAICTLTGHHWPLCTEIERLFLIRDLPFNSSRVGVATMGAPLTFVGNYNVRLHGEF
jgi:hypothetical protein